MNSCSNLDLMSLKLYEMLVSGSSLQSIADEAQLMLDNPLIIADKSCKVLCSSGFTNMKDSSPWAEIVKSGYYPPSYFSLLSGKNNDNSKLYLLYTLEEPVELDDPCSGQRVLIFRLGLAAMPFGFAMLIEHNKPASEDDRKLFMTFCKIASTELRSNAAAIDAKKRTYEYIFAEILDGRLYGDQLRQQLIAVNIEPKRPRCLFVVEKDGSGQISYEYIRDSMENMLHKCKCFIYNNKVAILFDLIGNFLLTEEERSRMKKFLVDNGLICGGSSKFNSMSSLPSAYSQAITASRIGRQMEGRGPIYYLWEYATYHMCDLLHNEHNLIDFVNPLMLGIMRYDKDNNTSFIQTIRAYLKCGRNPVKTAALLGIHRNSVDYRIRRMNELFYLDFNDSNIMFSFEQSLQIIDYLEKNE